MRRKSSGKMPQIELAKIELKEILRHLDVVHCDEEVVQKLADAAGVRIEVEYTRTGNEKEGDVLPRYSGKIKMVADKHPPQPRGAPEEPQRPPKEPPGDERNDMGLLVLDARLKAQGWTQEEVDRVNQQRTVAVLSARRMMEANPGEPISKYTITFPPGYGIRHTKIGDKNAAGDECVDVDANGFSVFVCKNEHAYADENPARNGCPQCFMSGGGGGGGSAEAARTSADEEPF